MPERPVRLLRLVDRIEVKFGFQFYSLHHDELSSKPRFHGIFFNVSGVGLFFWVASTMSHLQLLAISVVRKV